MTLLENLGQKIATTLKLLRQTKGWSLDSAAKKTGVSKAMLGQIERMESSPTIATLWKIASGFDVSFSSFVEDLGKENAGSKLHQIHPEDDKIRILPLFTYDARLKFEAFMIELLRGCEHLSPPHQKGVVEHVIVTHGEIDIYHNGAWQTLKENEGLRFNADQPHGYRNKSAEKAVFHNIIHYGQSHS